MDKKIIELIRNTIKKGQVLINEPMSKHTTFKVGGNAEVFIIPGSIEEAENIIRLLCVNKESFVTIGNGSNILVSDDGIRGAVVSFSSDMEDIEINGNVITCSSGILLSKVSKAALDNSLTGLEFASGIPGSLGGAIYMNAGAYGGEMKDVVKEVTVFNTENETIEILTAEEMDFSYRHSIAKEKSLIILSAKMELKKGDADLIRETMADLNAKRREKQPLEYPSAGSTFKRPEGYFAGKLIEDAGLRGYRVGGAQVSEKHCGFVINRDNATATDVITLIKDVQKKVYDDSNVVLETEVVMLGFDR